jgi:hypothetical protein
MVRPRLSLSPEAAASSICRRLDSELRRGTARELQSHMLAVVRLSHRSVESVTRMASASCMRASRWPSTLASRERSDCGDHDSVLPPLTAGYRLTHRAFGREGLDAAVAVRLGQPAVTR